MEKNENPNANANAEQPAAEPKKEVNVTGTIAVTDAPKQGMSKGLKITLWVVGGVAAAAAAGGLAWYLMSGDDAPASTDNNGQS